MTLLITVLVAVICGAFGYGVGRVNENDRIMKALSRYEKSMRETHGNQPTPATVLELPGLQVAIRYLMRLR